MQVLVPRDVAALMALRAPCAPVVSLGGETMGTTWSVKLVPTPQLSPPALRARIVAILGGVNAQMSTWIAHSDIGRFNHAGAGTWHVLPDDFHLVLAYALQVAAQTQGAYDPTAGALVDLWGFGPHGRPGVPRDDAIAAAQTICGWERVKLDGTRVLQPGGIRLDLSSVAKGFAVDRVSAHLASRGITDHLVEIGGELRGNGTKPDGSPWWVALEPRHRADGDEAAAFDTVVALHHLAIATSGDSQRFFSHEGRRLSHTIDPRTGHPVPERLASVTVLHRRCMHADALATALLVLGPDEGFALAVRLGLPARFILRHAARFEHMMTPAMQEMLG